MHFILSLLLRLFFALPSLQGWDNNIGFREVGIKHTHVFAAYRAGSGGRDRTNFMEGRRKGDASMERGWCSLGTDLVRGWCSDEFYRVFIKSRLFFLSLQTKNSHEPNNNES